VYKDIEEKIKFHKERIIRDFIKKGIYPSNVLIAELLNEIDQSIALFVHDDIEEGSNFDTSKYNNELNLIYKDLKILYDILYKVTIEDYISLKAFADSHMLELESVSEMYKKKAEMEINSTSLGNTILFKHGSFNVNTDTNPLVLNLGTVKVNKGSVVSCIVNANNVPADSVTFNLSKENEVLTANAYNYNGDQITIPGAVNIKTYTTTIPEDKNAKVPVKMDIDSSTSDLSTYAIFAAKNSILLKNYNNITQKTVSLNVLNQSSFYLQNRCYIDFYIVGGNTITFKFNKKPISANFPLDNYIVSNLNRVHHFVIEGDIGFALSFEIDKGDVYAIKDNGYKMNDELYFSKLDGIKDFYIEEYSVGEPDEYNAYISIKDCDDTIGVETVMIKELLKMEG
jgi:hypothetical protein